MKFKWRWARERPENELLILAKNKRAWGAVSIDHYKEIENTPNLRRGLRWGPQRKFVSVQTYDGRQRSINQEQTPNCNADGLLQYTEESDNYFQNRILTCIVTCPLGRPLCTFQSLAELLQVFRDAIKCHRSLYNDAKILHHDISPGNVIILDHQEREQPKGI